MRRWSGSAPRVPCILLRSRGERQISVTFSPRRKNTRGMLLWRHVQPRREAAAHVLHIQLQLHLLEDKAFGTRIHLYEAERHARQTDRDSGDQLRAALRRPPFLHWPQSPSSKTNGGDESSALAAAGSLGFRARQRLPDSRCKIQSAGWNPAFLGPNVRV